jgi:hypothetical protein
MMRNSVIAALLSALLACVTAFAQHNPVWSSIDLNVAQADRVFVGHIIEMGEATGIPGHNDAQQPIVLAVDEMLKGEPVSRFETTVAYDLWQQLSREKVLCQGCPQRAHRLLLTIRPAAQHASTATDLDNPSVLDVAGDLRLLTGGNAILQAAREEVHRQPGVLDAKMYFAWGPSESFMPGTPFHGCTVYVPIDQRQETLAHGILASQPAPSTVGGTYTNDRPGAASVLVFFRSPRNLRLLKSLLSDPQIEHAAHGQLDYPIRIAAYKVLKRWGRNVPAPITTIKIQEPWDGKLPQVPQD